MLSFSFAFWPSVCLLWRKVYLDLPPIILLLVCFFFFPQLNCMSCLYNTLWRWIFFGCFVCKYFLSFWRSPQTLHIAYKAQNNFYIPIWTPHPSLYVFPYQPPFRLLNAPNFFLHLSFYTCYLCFTSNKFLLSTWYVHGTGMETEGASVTKTSATPDLLGKPV